MTAQFTDPVVSFGDFTVVLEGYGPSDSIDVRDVLIRTGSTVTYDASGNPTNVDVSGNTITIELQAASATANPTGIEIGSNDFVEITIRKRAGVTAPTLAGKYDVSVGDETAADIVMVSSTLSVDPGKGGSATDITVTGKALANGTGTLASQTLEGPDDNADGIADTLVEGKMTRQPAAMAVTASTPTATVKPILASSKTMLATLTLRRLTLKGRVTQRTTSKPWITTLGETPQLVRKPLPTIPAATSNDDAESLTGATERTAAFTATVSAGDLVIGDNGMSHLRFTDANGDEASRQVPSYRHLTLGADSVGKGRVLKISLSDWILKSPTLSRSAGWKFPLLTTKAWPKVVEPR